MKRVVIPVLVVAVALGLAFTVAANLFPDWTWKMLNPVRNTAAALFGRQTSKVNLSKYLPGDSLKAAQVKCSSLPKNALHTIIVRTPSDEICAHQIGDLSENNYGIIAYPLRGWVGCIDGHDLPGVNIDALTSDGKKRLASTVANGTGRFSLPNLKAGTYHLVASSKGVSRVDVLVTVSPQSNAALCIVAEGTTE